VSRGGPRPGLAWLPVVTSLSICVSGAISRAEHVLGAVRGGDDESIGQFVVKRRRRLLPQPLSRDGPYCPPPPPHSIFSSSGGPTGTEQHGCHRRRCEQRRCCVERGGEAVQLGLVAAVQCPAGSDGGRSGYNSDAGRTDAHARLLSPTEATVDFLQRDVY